MVWVLVKPGYTGVTNQVLLVQTHKGVLDLFRTKMACFQLPIEKVLKNGHIRARNHLSKVKRPAEKKTP